MFVHRRETPIAEHGSFEDERRAALQSVLGRPRRVHEDDRSAPLPVDVYEFAPGPEREWSALITSGMSDLAMPTAPEPDLSRAELILYVNEAEPEHVSVLREVACMPHVLKTWFGLGHTVAHQHGIPLFEGSALSVALFLEPLAPEAALAESLVVDGRPVQPLWLFPITASEAQLKLDQGLETLLDRLIEADVEVPLDERRGSVV